MIDFGGSYVIAASSHWANPIFEGFDPRRGHRFVYYDIIVGGMGARPHKDGAEAVCGSFNLENIPVEVNESNYPILIERLELIRDSAGAGTFRGSCGLRKDIRFLGERGSVSNLSDRHRFPPPARCSGRSNLPPVCLFSSLRRDPRPGHGRAVLLMPASTQMWGRPAWLDSGLTCPPEGWTDCSAIAPSTPQPARY